MSTDDRLKNSASKTPTRTHDDRPSHEQSLSRSERLSLFRGSDFQEVLPVPPELPGYHLIWLSTENKHDTLSSRERKGYRKVLPEELPDFCHQNLKTASDTNEIRCAEMILYKIEEDTWYDIMKFFHHEIPLGGEQEIKDAAERAIVDKGTRKSLLRETGDGTGLHVNDAPIPKTFSG